MAQSFQRHTIEEILQAHGVIRELGEEGGAIQKKMRDEVLRRYSMRIDDVLREKNAREYCRARGVVYVGEFPYVRKGRIGRIYARVLSSLGLSESCDPIKNGWIPSYWSDANFMDALSLPCIVYFGDYTPWKMSSAPRRSRINTLAHWLHSNGIHYLGQLLDAESGVLRKMCGEECPDDLTTIVESLLASRKKSPLRAGMIVPRSWEPDLAVPQVWLCEMERIAKEIELYETPCAWAVTWLVVDGRYCDPVSVQASVIPAFFADPNVPGEEQRRNAQSDWAQRRFISDLNKEIAAGTVYRYSQDMRTRRTDGILGAQSLNSEKQNYFPGMNLVTIQTYAHGTRVFLQKEDAESFRAIVATKAGELLDDE